MGNELATEEKVIRLKRAILAALAVLAVSGAASSAAQAAVERNPEWVVAGAKLTEAKPLKPTLEAKTWLLKGTFGTVTCTELHVLKGSIGPAGKDSMEVLFLKCTFKNVFGQSCNATTSGDATGVIGPISMTSELVWATSSVGTQALDLVTLPSAGVTFNTETCGGTVTVKGSVLAQPLIAGKLALAKEESVAGELNYPEPNIKEYETWNSTTKTFERKKVELTVEGGVSGTGEEIGVATKLELESKQTYGWA